VKLDEDKAITRQRYLYNEVNGQEGIMVRNRNRYENSGTVRRSLWEPKNPPSTYNQSAKGSNGIQTQVNVIKSAIDTLTSKVSEAAVRPYFNSIGGDFDTRQLLVQMQKYFDVWFDEQHAMPKSSICFRDCCTFSKGVMFVDPESQSLARIPSWTYCINPGEYDAKTITEVGINWGRYVPLARFKEYLQSKKLKERLEEDPHQYGQYDIYWDLYHGFKYEMFDGEFITDPLPLDYEIYGGLYRRPFVEIWYNQPINGYFPPSLADELYSLQKNIDSLLQRLDAATRNAVVAMVLLPEGAGLKASDVENGYHIYPYQPTVDGAKPEFMTPPPLDMAWVEILKYMIEQSYEIAGISQVSAASKVPSNVESGKMLDSIENTESERFNLQLQQFTHFLIDCARVAIDCFPKEKSIIEKKTDGDKLTWGKVRQSRALYEIQFTPASILSKNPEEKINQISSLAAQGIIDKGLIADLLQIPDLERAETSISASYHYCQRIIRNAVKDEDYDYFEGVDLLTLLREANKTLNVMHANGDKEEYSNRVLKLMEKVMEDIQGLAVLNKPSPPPPPPAPFEPLKDYNFSGDQIQAINAIIMLVRDKQVPPGTGIAVMTACFPKIPPPLLNSMFTPLETFQAPAAAPGEAPLEAPGGAPGAPVGLPPGGPVGQPPTPVGQAPIEPSPTIGP
jgi:hypothetical protein